MIVVGRHGLRRRLVTFLLQQESLYWSPAYFLLLGSWDSFGLYVDSTFPPPQPYPDSHWRAQSLPVRLIILATVFLLLQALGQLYTGLGVGENQKLTRTQDARTQP